MLFRISVAARVDLHEIWTYIADDNPIAADATLSLLEDEFETIARFPRIGRRRDDVSDGMRSIAVGRFVILYRIRKRLVEIVRVVAGERDIGQLFEIDEA